ncbi:hypothetical protein [Trinickia soli]|uniref:hypothetical protein n=1 Tax=Trinickia soli TaxID=380675 RepID=UPI00125C57EF|nr:hypothetical protein CIW54_15820 [Paraburkholderia sp. T12-10]
MTLLLLDTNAYLRFAKRIKPLLGVPFGAKKYHLTVLSIVEDEFRRSLRLQERFPWFGGNDLAEERLATRVRLSDDEKEMHKAATSVLRQSVLDDPLRFTNPPSQADCEILAFTHVRESIVVTDDLSMHKLAEEFAIDVMHGHHALHKMLAARKVDKALIREIYDALEANGDLPASWKREQLELFKSVFK